MAKREAEKTNLPTDLQKSLELVNGILLRRTRGEKAIADTRDEITKLEMVVHQNRLALGSIAAEQLLSGTAVGAGSGAQAENLRKTKNQLEESEATLQGLESAVRGTEAELQTAFVALEAARGAWIDTQVRAYESEYDVALKEFFAIVQRGRALADGLGTTLNGLIDLKFLDVYGTPRHYLNHGYVPTWRQDEAAMQEYNRVSDVFGVSSRIKRILSRIEAERRDVQMQRVMNSPVNGGTQMNSAYEAPAEPPVSNIQVTPGRGGNPLHGESSGHMYPAGQKDLLSETKQ